VSGSPVPVSDRAKVSIRGLEMAFRADSGEIRVLEDIDLDVREGEFVCILGPSGCGKSTLLNVVAGFLDPTAGAVLIDGEEVRGPDPRRIFVFQERGVFPWLTAAGNIGFGLGRLPRAERERRVAHYVALVLYLDEPFGALDSITRLVMRAELLRIWQAERKTILFVTHDIEESVQLADRVVVMSNRPARIRRIVPIDLPHPRDLSSRRYLELRDGIFEEIGLAHRI